MMVPSIDLMDGKAVQLRRGEKLVLTSDTDPVALAERFNLFGEVAVIDLDAAMGRGDNLELIKKICKKADVRAGGGIRDEKRGKTLLRAGAKKIILGTGAEPELLSRFPSHRVIVALDQRNGQVVDRAWTRNTKETVVNRARRLEPYCGGYLCTFVQDEGGMKGIDLKAASSLKEKLNKPLTVAGGVKNQDEVIRLSQMDMDVQVGMALYTGQLDPVEVSAGLIQGLVPTIVQDEEGQVLMLAYSSRDSLRKALKQGKGVYYSRSRKEIWEKGLTSNHTQKLLSCRFDCDRDTLLFKVKQKGPACHTNQYSCFQQKSFSLFQLFKILEKRKAEKPADSYSVSLFNNRTKLLRKIMEEAHEVTLARDKNNLIWEISDLIYFLSVLAVDEGVELIDILAELDSRFKGDGDV